MGIASSTSLASAHTIKQSSGYSAVLHIDPDDEPSAHAPNAINFLIAKQHGSYNQNDYKITVGVAANGKSLARLKLEPEVFGNAADGVAHYTFPAIAAYSLNLHGVSLTDANDSFDMNFVVRVADNATGGVGSTGTGTGKVGEQALVLGSSSLVLLGCVGYVAISRGNRYATKS